MKHIINEFRRPDGTFTSACVIGNNCNPKGNPSSLLHETMEKHPSWKGGVQITKRDGLYKMIAPNVRIPMGRYVWINSGRGYTKGDVIVHKDGDVFNNDIENLVCMPRSEFIKYNKHRQ